MTDKITDGVMSELLKKKAGMEAREALLNSVDMPSKYADIDNDHLAEIFGIVKKLRWKMHHATTSYNLSVAQRRRHAPVNKFMSFAGRNTKFLTISRVILMMYCKDEEITAGSVLQHAEKYEISQRTLTRYFADAVAEGVFSKPAKGVYKYTQAALHHQLENLHRLLLNEQTYQLYLMLDSFYSLLDTALLQKDDKKFRRSAPSRLTKMLHLVESNTEKK
ncbi:MAG: hypothetical protein CL885_02385 [Dehalococcoidia bacterium]|nr:hypothetical protein [Dehalococcoidia bacterium]